MSYEFSKFKGIHKAASERVWVNNTWSIEIPVGYTYSIDPETSGMGLTGSYLLHVQNSSDCDLSNTYSSIFNLVVYDSISLLSCNCDDMRSRELLDLLENLPGSKMFGFNLFKNSKDLLVYYEIHEESKEVTSYQFYVSVRGTNILYMGQFRLYDGTISERKDIIHRWLDTIDVLTDEERLSFRDYSNTSKGHIPVEYREETAPIDEGVRICIPEGFHYETDPQLIGEVRRLVIVPDDYFQYDIPMEASVGLSVEIGVSENTPTDISKADTYFQFLCNFENSVFSKTAPVILCRHSDMAFSLSQKVLLNNAVSAITALYANNKSYILHISINYKEDEFDSALAVWDIDHLVRAWLGRIQIDDGSASGKTIRASQFLDDEDQSSKASEQDFLYSDEIIEKSGTEGTSKEFFNRYRDIMPDLKHVQNEDIEVVDGTLIKYHGNDEDILLPECILRIGESAFFLSKIRNVVIPKGVVAIDKNAFTACNNLEHVLLPDSLVEIKSGAFDGCRRLANILFPDGLKEIGEFAFSGCSGLTNIVLPDGVEEIGELAFQGCSNLTEIKLPKITENIPANVFMGCKNLKASSFDSYGIKLDDFILNGFDIRDDILWRYYGNNKDIIIPDGVIEISAFAFQECYDLESVTIPNSVLDIGFCAFQDCEKLESIIITNSVTNIDENAFEGCTSLKRVTKPDEIEDTHFVETPWYQAKDSNGFLIEDGVMEEYIGTASEVMIPVGVKEIASFAFSDCNSLTRITLPVGVKKIGEYAFSGCSRLISVTFLGSVEEIGDSAFSECDSLTEITLPLGLRTIGNWAFSYCNNLQSITIPNTVEKIGEGAFFSCEKITNVVKPEHIDDAYFALTPWHKDKMFRDIMNKFNW